MPNLLRSEPLTIPDPINLCRAGRPLTLSQALLGTMKSTDARPAIRVSVVNTDGHEPISTCAGRLGDGEVDLFRTHNALKRIRAWPAGRRGDLSKH